MLRMHGRDAELEQLMQAWDAVWNGGVRYVCISGEPGTGKTRLVQAFYEKIATSKQFNDAGYWPNMLDTDAVSENIRPPYPTAVKGNKLPAMPFFWWALRCNIGKQCDDESFAPASDGMKQIRMHLIGLMKAKRLYTTYKNACSQIALDMLGLLPILGNLATVGSLGKAVWDLFKDKREIDQFSILTLSNEEEKSKKLEEKLRDYFSALNSDDEKSLPTIPSIIILDDAHWADARTIGFTSRLMSEEVHR